MDNQQFDAQMNRLAAAYRVEVPAKTRAAYWLAFATLNEQRFAAACERAIEHERSFPPIAALKELIRQRHEITRRAAASTLAASASVGCLTCMDAGFIGRDLPVQHAEFGKLTPCPHCAGAKKPRNHKAEYAAFLERDHAEIARLRPYREQQAAARALTHPPMSVDNGPPPDDFALAGVPVPVTARERLQAPAHEAYSQAREMAEVSP